jgi:hypothetical protein
MIRQNLASTNAPFCYANNTTVRTGNVTGPVDDGINVRFDQPSNQISGAAALPAPNVIDGTIPGNCNNGSNWQTTGGPALPLDTCFGPPNTCEFGIAGDGDWSGTRGDVYWNTFHAAHNKADFVNTSNNRYGEVGYTRFDLYLKELNITEAQLNDSPLTTSPFAPTNPAESADPVCTPKTTAGVTAQRRVFAVAMVNCQQYEGLIQGNSPVPIRDLQYARFFITNRSVGGEFYAELIDTITPAADPEKKLHRQVQLYR